MQYYKENYENELIRGKRNSIFRKEISQHVQTLK